MRFLYGWLVGIVYWLCVCYWIQSTLENHGGMSVAESWALFILFCFAKAIQMGCFAWLLPYAARGWWAAPALAALWTFFEWTHNFTGFAWLVLGNIAIDWPVLPRLAPFTGVWGISFALALIPAIVVTRQWRWIALLVIPFFLPQLPHDGPASLTARAVQPNISEDAAWSAESKAALERHLTELSFSPIQPTLIVWPEVPAPIYERDRFLGNVPKIAGAPLLAGVVAHTDHGGLLNSALLHFKRGPLH